MLEPAHPARGAITVSLARDNKPYDLPFDLKEGVLNDDPGLRGKRNDDK